MITLITERDKYTKYDKNSRMVTIIITKKNTDSNNNDSKKRIKTKRKQVNLIGFSWFFFTWQQVQDKLTCF